MSWVLDVADSKLHSVSDLPIMAQSTPYGAPETKPELSPQAAERLNTTIVIWKQPILKRKWPTTARHLNAVVASTGLAAMVCNA